MKRFLVPLGHFEPTETFSDSDFFYKQYGYSINTLTIYTITAVANIVL